MGTFEISNKKAQVFNSINKLRERSVTAVKHYKLKLHPKDILNKQQVFFLAIFINHILVSSKSDRYKSHFQLDVDLYIGKNVHIALKFPSN